ncbi:MAG: glycosyltransferase family 4 protein [Lachnospiraceae bacterium]|nr:glycosyltransferase family 4 protein [Lachnospiraceae bacterium]
MKVQLYHEVHDIWPETLTTIGNMSKRHPFVRILQMAEDSAYKNSDKVISMMPYAGQHMMVHGMEKEKFIYIPNGIAQSEWKGREQIPAGHQAVFEKLKKQQKFIVGYFGGHALSNSLDVLLACAERLKDNPKFAFVLAGDGVEKPKLIETAKRERLENVWFLDSVAKIQVPDLLTYFDCIFISTKDSPLYRYGINMNKMFDAMMGGKPIILSVTTKRTPVEEYQCGYVTKAGEIDKIVKSIMDLACMEPECRRKMGEQGKKAIEENFTYRKLARKLEKVWAK